MNKLAIAAVMGTALLMTGCASILNDKNQQINVTSTNGKSFQGTVDGVPFTGPGVVSVARQKSPKVFKVDTQGCAPQTSVDPSIDLKFWGNIIFGGLLGSTTDASTEKMWKYSDNVTVTCSQ